jgi:hypothetical protein
MPKDPPPVKTVGMALGSEENSNIPVWTCDGACVDVVIAKKVLPLYIFMYIPCIYTNAIH